ncbi:alpha/beta hydrolase [Pseudoduganella namucuonensis]|uniref:Acetyl esterase/lipase n=1 Tax=Pseudoduganella namucuonensis TaxID=1035707 RepID=A0A1I7LUJ9_9BURK|nr:alpha/beta hydrolase [Pseudoduganella namucuonensis]SFV13329.1 Acetyl esterase/lipase [Pseudoduganella namucuonensis]
MKSWTLAALLLAATGALAQSSVVTLWAGGVPDGGPRAKRVSGPERLDDERISNVSLPTLAVYPAAYDRQSGTAVVICPGGGYEFLSYTREGHQYAQWLSSLGVTAFVLKYRLSGYGHPAPLQDVLHAIRLVRSQAGKYGVAPDRIGVMGSSAGGHLAASAATLFNHPSGRGGDALDAVSARPDFAMLMYPVISMSPPVAHMGSRQALLGAEAPPELVELMSLDKQVGAATPPTLLIHSQDDGLVPADNSILFFQALTRARVPAELMIFERGGHGMAMRAGQGTASNWPRRAEEWLRDRKLIQ